MTVTVQKWGNGLGVRIPKAVAAQVDFRHGTAVEIEAANGTLTIRAKRRKKYTLAGLLAKAKRRHPYGELHRDGPVGREIV